jgi:hypothetical protein
VDITTNTNEIQRTMREFFENLYPNQLENLEEIDEFLDGFDQLKLNQEDINHLNRSKTKNEIEAILKCPNKEKPRSQQIHC